MSNVKLEGGHLQLAVGRGKPKTLNTIIRSVNEFIRPQGEVRSIAKFINIMLDKRGPGLWQGVVGGPKSKTEHLAELMVTHGVVEQVATQLMDGNLLRNINDKVVRNNQRFRSGVFTMDYPSLFDAVSSVVGGSKSANDPARHVTRIITEIISQAYTKINVMVPFVGVVELMYEVSPIANTDTIITAADVAAVSEILEMIELSISIKDAREFSPTVTEAILGPMLTQAANRLMATVRYRNYIKDTAVLVGRFIAKPSILPEHVADNADLAYLATNASFAMDAILLADKPVVTPDFDLREAISYTTTRIRELKRFESVSIERFREMYSHSVVRNPDGSIAGAFVHRNETFAINPQVSKFVDRKSFFLQSPVPVAEAYLSPITEAISRAYGDGMLIKTIEVASQHLLTRMSERYNTFARVGGHLLALNMSESELTFYALGFADRMYIVNQTDDENAFLGSRIVMGVADTKAFYEPIGIHSGNEVLVDDPLEVLLLKQEDHVGTGAFPNRPQTILDDLRQGVLADLGPEELMLDFGKDVKITLPMLNKTKIESNQSLQKLLGLESLREIHLTVNLAAASQLTNAMAALSYIYTILKTNKESNVDQMLARQVAIATHSLYGRVATSDTVYRLIRGIFLNIVQDPAFTADRTALRTHLSTAFVQQQLALSTTSLLLLKTGLLEFGVQNDISEMFADENVVEVATTSESWAKIMNPITR